MSELTREQSPMHVAIEQSAMHTAKCIQNGATALVRKTEAGIYEVAVLAAWQGVAADALDGVVLDAYDDISRQALSASHDCAAFLAPYGISLLHGWTVRSPWRVPPRFVGMLADSDSLPSPEEVQDSRCQGHYQGCMVVSTTTGCLVRLCGETDYYQVGGRYLYLPTVVDAQCLINRVLFMRRAEETNGARIGVAWHDIIYLTCTGEAQELAEALQEEFGDDGLLITASGRTCKRDQGHLVIDWEGEVSAAFLLRLQAERRVLDYALYHMPRTRIAMWKERQPIPHDSLWTRLWRFFNGKKQTRRTLMQRNPFE